MTANSLPLLTLPSQHDAPCRRHRVKTPPPLPRLLDPAALDPAAPFHPVEDGIERGDTKLDLPARPFIEELPDVVAVASTAFQDGQHQQLHGAALQFDVCHVFDLGLCVSRYDTS